MSIGPGQYDDEVTMVRERTHAKGVIVIVLGGDRGDNFAIQATPGVAIAVPRILRALADDIEADCDALWRAPSPP